jgi:hypothetical protein
MVGVDVLVIDWAGGRMMYSCNLHKFSWFITSASRIISSA